MKYAALLVVILAATIGVLGAVEKTSVRPDGTKVIIDTEKSVKTFIYTNGTKKVIDLKGKTPYGAAIEEINIPIQNDPVTVTFIYDPLKSDEALDGDIKLLVESLQDLLKRSVGGTRYKGSQDLSIVVSYCRYGEYGYCLNKEHKVYVMFIEKDGNVKDTLELEGYDLKDKKKRVLFVREVVKAFKE